MIPPGYAQARKLHQRSELLPKGFLQLLPRVSQPQRNWIRMHSSKHSWTQNHYPFLFSIKRIHQIVYPSILNFLVTSFWRSSCPSLQLAMITASLLSTPTGLPNSKAQEEGVTILQGVDYINVHQTLHFSILGENYITLPC